MIVSKNLYILNNINYFLIGFLSGDTLNYGTCEKEKAPVSRRSFFDSHIAKIAHYVFTIFDSHKLRNRLYEFFCGNVMLGLFLILIPKEGTCRLTHVPLRKGNITTIIMTNCGYAKTLMRSYLSSFLELKSILQIILIPKAKIYVRTTLH